MDTPKRKGSSSLWPAARKQVQEEEDFKKDDHVIDEAVARQEEDDLASRVSHHSSQAVEEFRDSVARVKRRLDEIRGGLFRRWAHGLVTPGNYWAIIWDLVVFTALVFTAIVTPMEVSFVQRGVRYRSIVSLKQESAGEKVLFILNRIVDLVFVIDLLKNFVLSFRYTSGYILEEDFENSDNVNESFKKKQQQHHHHHTKIGTEANSNKRRESVYELVTRTANRARRHSSRSSKDISAGKKAVAADRAEKIRKNARRWLPVDFVSVLPFDLIALAARRRALIKLRLLRLLRLIRLLKLGHLEYILKQFQTRHSISFATISLWKYIAIIIISSHWMTCIWVLTANLQSHHEYTWVEALADNKNANTALAQARRTPFHRHSVSHRYTRGLYFTVYILTGLGLGDVVPSTNIETAVAIIFIVYGGIGWAWAIGNFCSIITTLDAHNIAFNRRMDELNYMMKERRLPHDLRERCRMYFHQSKLSYRMAQYSQLERHMSVGLRAQVAAASNSHWLDKVWYLRNASYAFMAEISVVLTIITFSPAEAIDAGGPSLFILRCGIAAMNGKILGKGAVWGADFVADFHHIIQPVVAIALTYTDTITLSRQSLEIVLQDFPEEADRIRRAMVWYIARALLLQKGRQIRRGQGEKHSTRPEASALLCRFAARPSIRRHLASVMRSHDTEVLLGNSSRGAPIKECSYCAACGAKQQQQEPDTSQRILAVKTSSPSVGRRYSFDDTAILSGGSGRHTPFFLPESSLSQPLR